VYGDKNQKPVTGERSEKKIPEVNDIQKVTKN
jgi:hypothetical protein